MTRLRLRLITVFVGFLFSIVIAEAFIRVMGYHPSSMDPAMFVANSNPLLPYKLRSNYHGYYAGAEFHVDKDGQRPVLPAANQSTASAERKILMLGDSVVFGQGLKDSDTLASQLQRSADGQNLPYSVANIGVPGYSSWNEYAALTEFLNRHEPPTDVVLLYIPNDITFENDYFGIGRGAVASYSGPEGKYQKYTRFIYSNFYLASLLRDSSRRLFASNTVGDMPAINSSNPSALDHSVEALSKIKELCNERKIRFVVGVYRDMAYFSDAKTWLSYEAMLTGKLSSKDISFVVLKSHIEKLQPAEIRVSWADPHPSARATSLMADEMLLELKRIGANVAGLTGN